MIKDLNERERNKALYFLVLGTLYFFTDKAKKHLLESNYKFRLLPINTSSFRLTKRPHD